MNRPDFFPQQLVLEIPFTQSVWKEHLFASSYMLYGWEPCSEPKVIQRYEINHDNIKNI